MTAKDRLLQEALSLTLETYGDMRNTTAAELTAARDELQTYLPKLIANGIVDRTQLAVRALARLRVLAAERPVAATRRRRFSARFAYRSRPGDLPARTKVPV